MSSSHTTSGGANAGKNLGQAVKEGATGIHGLGEAIRGEAMSGLDAAFGKKEGVAKNDAIAQKGVNEINDGQYRGYPEQKPKF